MARAIASWLSGIAAFLLLIELVLRILPVSSSTETGYYTDPLILSYPPHHHWTMSTGWDLRNAQQLKANNLGYVADQDFRRDEQAVALVGDSFVEASMLAAADRPGMQLERALDSRPVYAMGSPGTALLDYAERIRYAHEKFGIRDFVVLMERGDVQQSLCGSGNIHGPCLDRKTLALRIETIPSAGLAKRIFRHSALAQYLASQLKFTPGKLWRSVLAPSQPAAIAAHVSAPGTERNGKSDSAMREVDAVTTAFFARIKPHVAGKLVIVIDSNRSALYGGQLPPDWARDRFIYLARAAGAIIVDTAPLFQAHLARSPLKLDVGPYDGHLNALGVALIAKAAAHEIKQP